MATSIPISGLNSLSSIISSDFIPVVQSSSLTTYKMSTSVLGTWISSAVTVTSSLTTISASYAISSSKTISSSFASISSNLNYPNTSTASYSITSSYSVSSSWALQAATSPSSQFSISASWASASLSSSFAKTASFAVSASWANVSLSSTSASWASASISSSFLNGPHTGSTFGTSSWAVSASYANTTFGTPKAFASCIVSASFTTVAPNNRIKILSSYNISSITIVNKKIDTWMSSAYYCFEVNFINPMSSSQFLVVGHAGEYGVHIASYNICAPPNHSGLKTPITIPFRNNSYFSFFMNEVGPVSRTANTFTYIYFMVYDL